MYIHLFFKTTNGSMLYTLSYALVFSSFNSMSMFTHYNTVYLYAFIYWASFKFFDLIKIRFSLSSRLLRKGKTAKQAKQVAVPNHKSFQVQGINVTLKNVMIKNTSHSLLHIGPGEMQLRGSIQKSSSLRGYPGALQKA